MENEHITLNKSEVINILKENLKNLLYKRNTYISLIKEEKMKAYKLNIEYLKGNVNFINKLSKNLIYQLRELKKEQADISIAMKFALKNIIEKY